MTQPRPRWSRRIGLLAGAAVLVLTGACGTSKTPALPVGAGAPLPGLGSPPAVATTESAAPVGPWKTACALLPDAQVVAAASGYGTTISVTGHSPKEEQTDANGRISQCLFNLFGKKGGETLSGGGIELRIEETGAYLYFPPPGNAQTVPGLGDAAYWTSQSPPALYIQVGKRLYDVEGTVPILDSDSNDQINHEVILKVAKDVMSDM